MTKPSAYASGECTDLGRFTLPKTEQEVQTDAESAGFPEYDADFAEALEAREEARLTCGTPLALDPERSHVDRRVLQDMDADDRKVAEADERLKASRLLHDELRTVAVRAKHPPSATGPFLAYVLLAVGLALVTGALLTPTIDELFFVRYLRTRVENPELDSMLISYGIAATGVLMLCLAQLCVVGYLRGALGWYSTLMLFVADALFAAGWGIQRFLVSVPHPGGAASIEWRWQPMAVSLTALEFVLTFAYSLALHALAKWLRGRATVADAHRTAVTAAAKAKRYVEQEVKALERCRERRDALLAVVAPREVGARLAEDRRVLAASTVRVAYLKAASRLACTAAANPTLDALDEALDRHTAVFQARSGHEVGRRRS